MYDFFVLLNVTLKEKKLKIDNLLKGYKDCFGLFAYWHV